MGKWIYRNSMKVAITDYFLLKINILTKKLFPKLAFWDDFLKVCEEKTIAKWIYMTDMWRSIFFISLNFKKSSVLIFFIAALYFMQILINILTDHVGLSFAELH